MTDTDMQRLTAAIAREKDVEASAATLLETLTEKIKATKGDPNKVDELVAQLEANASALSAAVVSNTPAGGATGATGATDATGTADANRNSAQVMEDAKKSGIFTGTTGTAGATGATGDSKLGDGNLKTEATTGTSSV